MNKEKKILVSFLEGVNDDPLEAQTIDAVCALDKSGFSHLVKDFHMTLKWGKKHGEYKKSPYTAWGRNILACAQASKA